MRCVDRNDTIDVVPAQAGTTIFVGHVLCNVTSRPNTQDDGDAF